MSEVLGNNALTEVEKWEQDGALKTPLKWRSDKATGKLHMLFEEGNGPRLLLSRAKLEEANGFYIIAVLETSQRIKLWKSDRTERLNASKR